mmetsp:Transcript_14998/g.38941  ORF Transcript_14998/g.38941 Transcript_14998/m.38941 type:complete len:230 (+) Transcript_14998:974-1663(+)
MPPSAAELSFSFAWILTPFFGTNSGTITFSAARLKNAGSVLPFSPYIAARRLAAATINSRCSGSLASNWMAVGARFGPDQKGVPLAVTMSRGKLNRSCWIVLLYISSKRSRAHATHWSSVRGRSVTRLVCSTCSVGLRTPGCFSRFSRKSPLDRYAFASSAACLNSPSNESRAHWIVCSIWLGKFLSVHTGIERSGGSRLDAYDSVMLGTTTCTLPLVPRVPDSRSGFL